MIALLRRSFLATASLVFSFGAAEAAVDTLVNSRTVLMQGVKLNDEKHYKEAIKAFKAVPEGDTNYAIAVNELALTSLNDSAFADARTYALKGLALPGKPSRRSFML